jgi:putative spermidine/putrescine transport system permease protein
VGHVEVVLAVVFLALLIGVPAAYTLARRDFPGKRALMLLFLLPLMVPPITYGIPLATVLYQAHLAGTIWGVILANLIPAAPFVILVMTPFIEQIDANLDSAGARVRREHRADVLARAGAAAGAGHPRRVAARASAHDRIVRAHVPDRRFRFADAGRRALLRGVRRRRVRAPQSVDAMAMIYMIVTLVWLLIALRFVNPTQLVSRVKEHPQHA